MSEPTPLPVVPLRIKLVFWLLLGGVSVLLAEVVSSSYPFPFFTPWGLFVVIPLYLLHALVLGSLAFHVTRPVSLPALFIAGAIVGMYEAYMTKVLWVPHWAHELYLPVGGVAAIHTAILVLHWHPYMAFLLPWLIVETLFTSSREIGASLPERLRGMLGNKRRLLIALAIFAVFCGISQSFPGTEVLRSLLAVLSSVGVIFGLGYFWRRVSRGQAYTLRDLLPSQRQTICLTTLLLVMYLALGIGIHPDHLPRSLGPHLTILAMYAVLFALLYLHGKRRPSGEIPLASGPLPYAPWQIGLCYGIIFALTVVILGPIKWIAYIIVPITWVVGVLFGVYLLVRALR